FFHGVAPIFVNARLRYWFQQFCEALIGFVEFLIGRLRHPVQFAVWPAKEAIQCHRHVKKLSSHSLLRMLFLFSVSALVHSVRFCFSASSTVSSASKRSSHLCLVCSPQFSNWAGFCGWRGYRRFCARFSIPPSWASRRPWGCCETAWGLTGKCP